MTQDALRLLVCNDVETAVDDPDRVGRLAGTVEARRDDRTVVLDAGDSTAMGALAFTTPKGRGHAGALQRALAPDAHVPGNHDFDYGPAWLSGFAAGVPGTWLAANVDGGTHLDFRASVTLDVGNSSVGVVGVASPETPTICAAVEELAFTDPVAAAADAVSELHEAGADYVVVLSHCGPRDADIARETDADAVVGGHDHERVVEHVEGTLVARTAGVGRELLEVELGQRATAVVHETADFPISESVVATYRDRAADAGLDERLGTLETERSAAEAAERVAEAYRVRGENADGDRGVDIGFVAEASVREPLSGTVTAGDIVGTVPFGSTLATVELDADALRAAVETTTGANAETPGVWAGVDADAVLDGESREEPVTVGCMSYHVYVEQLPGFSEDTVVADAGPQHEQVLADVRERGLVGR